MLSQLQADLAQAHVEVISAQAHRNICANDFNKAEASLSAACRKRYVANRALDIELLKLGPLFEI